MQRPPFKIYPGLLTCMLLVLVSLVWFQGESMDTAFLNIYRHNIETRTRLYQELIKPYLGNDMARAAEKIKHFSKVSQNRVSVMDNQGKILIDTFTDPASISNQLKQPEVLGALKDGVGISSRYSDVMKEKQLYLATTAMGNDGEIYVLRLGMSKRSFDEMLAMARRDTILISIIMILFMICAGLYTNLMVLKPIAKIKRRCHDVVNGAEPCFEVTGGHRIIDELTEDIEMMTQSLYHKINQLQLDLNKHDVILSSMAEGIIAVNDKCVIAGLNSEAGRLLGVHTLREGMSLESLPQGKELANFAASVMKNRRPDTIGIRIGESNQTVLRVKGSVLKIGKYELAGVLLMLNDQTRIYQLENFRRDFIANISHEIKTPLTVISAAIESLKDGACYDPKQADEFLTMIFRQSERLNNLVKGILSISALESHTDAVIRFSDFDLVPLIRNAVEMTRMNSNIKVDLPESLIIYGDSQLMDQAIANLTSNAVKYASASEILVKTWVEEKIIIIQVIDNGIGIPREHLPRIFERFYRVDKNRSRKLGGTGLGLSIVKHVIQHHQGTVAVESSIGKGCIFTIRLPL